MLLLAGIKGDKEHESGKAHFLLDHRSQLAAIQIRVCAYSRRKLEMCSLRRMFVQLKGMGRVRGDCLFDDQGDLDRVP